MSLIREFVWCKLYDLEYVRVDLSSSWKKYITIYRSYKITKTKHMKEVLNWLKTYPEVSEVLKLPMWVLIAEWKAHNLLYDLNYQRQRTEHLDIESTLDLKNKVGYALLSLFYWR